MSMCVVVCVLWCACVVLCVLPAPSHAVSSVVVLPPTALCGHNYCPPQFPTYPAALGCRDTGAGAGQVSGFVVILGQGQGQGR